MNFTAAVIAIIFIIFLRILKNYFQNVHNYWKKRGVNGPVPLPLFGNFFINLIRPTNEIEEQRLIKYGRVYGTFEFFTPMLTIADPSLIREVSIKQFHNFQNRYNRVNDEFFDKSIFFSLDNNWKTLRSYLSPVFTSKKMKKMFRYVEQCTDNTIKYIDSIGNREVVLKTTMLSFTMDVVCKCVFGVNTNGYEDPNNEFLVKAQKMLNISLYRVFGSLAIPKKIQNLHNLLDFSLLDKQSLNYFKNVLNSIISERKNNKVENDDFVNLLLKAEELEQEEDVESNSFNSIIKETQETSDFNKNIEKIEKKKLNNEEILAQGFALFIAGYETTSTLLNFTFYTLAVNPDVQERLHEEIKKYFGNTNEINFDIIHSLPYLDAVVNESLRMYSPVVVLDRLAGRDITLGDGSIKIEKGTVVNLPFYAIHHDPEFFPDPHTFKPERFLPENKHLIEPYTFIPFGVGPRNCIGMRLALMAAKIFIIKVLKQFKVLRTSNTAVKPKFTKILGGLGSEPLRVCFAARKP